MSSSTHIAMAPQSKLVPSAFAIILRSLIEISCARLLDVCGMKGCISRSKYKHALRFHAFNTKKLIPLHLIAGGGCAYIRKVRVGVYAFTYTHVGEFYP